MGILSWRNANDEKLIQAISDACTSDPGYEIKVNGKEESYSLQSDLDGDASLFCSQDQVKPTQKKLLIIDARSYAAAMTNRAKGGGYECDGYYSNCEIQYMGLANIHTIRNSFACVRALCAAPDDSWLSSLENTKWLNHISGLIRAALLVVNSVDVEKRPVLVHCSDGWDRTPQIVALAEIMLDPYYRTKKGFQVLVEREWLQFGHKFADRCGQSGGTEDRNERSPVFIQWLDCIYQLLEQFECHFEFNQQYLARLVLHTYSCLFGTFLCNTDQSRNAYKVSNRTFSVWPVLNEKSQFHNYLFNHSNEVLRPSYHIRNLKFWSDVYLPNNSVNLGRSTMPPVEEPLPEENLEKSNLVKTKSCDNIPCAEHSLTLQRRNSDPNIVENTFIEPVLYPHIPEYTEKISTHNSNIMENSVLSNLCNGFGADRSELDDLERTGSKSFGISHSNLVLKEPTIDGSTDTLVSENGALVQEQCRNESSHTNSGETFSYSKLTCSVSTSTTDLPLTVEGVLQSVTQNISYIDSKMPNWCQNVIGAFISNKRNSDTSNSCSCSYTNQ
ncbi:myotubularin-related protein 3-like [Stegodyphus dumicola]|uniref:myotubularin-related protein 3-like n=1 Tax=Stegodyphus dumicola TaxID=202533 RepID=UPI0015A8FBA3|nr:myotubularin-related protein 3-like [Stegodyphus dumicola]